MTTQFQRRFTSSKGWVKTFRRKLAPKQVSIHFHVRTCFALWCDLINLNRTCHSIPVNTFSYLLEKFLNLVFSLNTTKYHYRQKTITKKKKKRERECNGISPLIEKLLTFDCYLKVYLATNPLNQREINKQTNKQKSFNFVRRI